jgi:hypothetical protein
MLVVCLPRSADLQSKRGADVTPTGRRKRTATQSCVFVTCDNDPYDLRVRHRVRHSSSVTKTKFWEEALRYILVLNNDTIPYHSKLVLIAHSSFRYY